MMLDAIAMAGSRKCVRGVSAVARGNRGVSGVARATPIFQILFHKTVSPQNLKSQSPQTLKPTSPQIRDQRAGILLACVPTSSPDFGAI